jgi:hypothetical protein
MEARPRVRLLWRAALADWSFLSFFGFTSSIFFTTFSFTFSSDSRF